METLKIVGICGSLRKNSTNLGLLRYAQEHAPEGMEIRIAELKEVPFFNADLELEDRPSAVQTLLRDIEAADALLLACPEYNYSLAPALKNALDWASREKDNRLLAGKPAAILGSGGGLGSARAQYHLRQVCVYLDLRVLNKPEIFCNAFAGGFDPSGNLIDVELQKLVDSQLEELQSWAHKIRT
ncbi:NADPH-dependent FMN reductase [uncultured Desulfuromusa sp.]|uniref:NADPH-dependent FMN reductase n=1 Tax=uncultured Desulfuromusa sp. TaxID=219183 RepID=UPI002AA873F9|nr:NADPH-dependent FMN reductase [uncultured Desulfuromusa sp.]